MVTAPPGFVPLKRTRKPGNGGANRLSAKKICYLTSQMVFFQDAAGVLRAPCLFAFFDAIVHEVAPFARPRA